MAQDTATAPTDTALPAPGSMGWAPFTLADQRTLNLNDVQMSRLREMDEGFADAYKGMGIEPWQHKDFPALNRERNTAIRDILDDQQYRRWATPSAPVPAIAPTIIPDSAGQPEK